MKLTSSNTAHRFSSPHCVNAGESINIAHKTHSIILGKILIVFAVSLTLLSCGNNTDQLQKQVDSLQTALQLRNDDYANLHEFVTIFSEGLDSINAQEDVIFYRNPESPLPNREQLKRSLSHLKETIQQQRDKIKKLEDKLSESQGDVKNLQTIIKALKQQIEQKDAQISELMVQLEQSKLSVEQLTSRVGTLTQKTSEQATQIAQQEEVMQAQDQALNEGYIKMGTKKELKEAGLLSGGFLKKTKVDYSNINLDMFQKIDIREVTSITIPSKSPKILTNVPTGSYTLQKEGQNTILVISDPTTFWSVSNFLIIQTK